MTQNRTFIKKYAMLIRLFVLLKSSERKVFSKRASYPHLFHRPFTIYLNLAGTGVSKNMSLLVTG